MPKAEAYRNLVEARAGGSCEYCRLLQVATGVTFHIEHFIPRSQDGPTLMSNLVLSCPGCNLAKADRTVGDDQQPLFNPRDYKPWLLGWHLHFTLDHETGLIFPRTLTAEATVNALRMNDGRRVFARKLQIVVGLLA